MIELFGPVVDIAMVGVSLSLLMQLLQRKFVDRKQMKVQQEFIKKKQQKLNELMKKADDKSVKEMEKVQSEMMEAMNSMMQGSMKQMVISMAVILPIFWFLSSNYANVVVDLPFPVPFWAAWDWFNPLSWFVFKLWNQTSWIGWYVLVSLVTSLSVNGILNLLEKKQS